MSCSRRILRLCTSILLSFGLGTTSVAIAKVDKKETKKETKKVPPKEAKKEAKPAELAEPMDKSKGKRTSSMERKTKSFGMQGGLGLVAGLPTVGGSLNMFTGKNKNVVLLGGGNFGTGSLGDSKATNMEVSGALRLILGDSFFVEGGCGYGMRSATHTETVSQDFSSWKESVSIARFWGGVGNEWQWHSLFLSAQWAHLGYNMKLRPVSNDIPMTEDGVLLATSSPSSLEKVPGSIEIGAMVSLGFAF